MVGSAALGMSSSVSQPEADFVMSKSYIQIPLHTPSLLQVCHLTLKDVNNGASSVKYILMIGS